MDLRSPRPRAGHPFAAALLLTALVAAAPSAAAEKVAATQDKPAPAPQKTAKKPSKKPVSKAPVTTPAKGSEGKKNSTSVGSSGGSDPTPTPRPSPVRLPPAISNPLAGLTPKRGAGRAPKRGNGDSGRGEGRSRSEAAGGGIGGASARGAAGRRLSPAARARSAAAAAGIERGAARRAQEARSEAAAKRRREAGSPVERTVRDIVEVVPDSLKAALAALAALAVMLAAGYLFTALRARRLGKQRRQLLEEVGLLQAALLPPVPERFGALRVSVAYRPAEGLAAGGDFYDVLALPGDRTGLLLGDVSGHGRPALARTAFLRYTLRAYLQAGLEPRTVLRLAGQVIEDLDDDFATVLIVVHDPATGSLTYAAAGHPAPLVVGPARHQPVLAASSPPIGTGLPTGLRQTTVPLLPGSVACLYTDGLTEARTQHGVLGRGRLGDLLDDLGREATAPELLERVAKDARAVTDDMAACLLSPAAAVTAGGFRTEQLELDDADLAGPLAARFLEACGVAEEDAENAIARAREEGERVGGAVLEVSYGMRGRTVEVLPRNVESLEAASLRARAI